MKKLILLFIVISITLTMVGCDNPISQLIEKTPHEKAVEYVKENGIESGSQISIAYQDYFLDNYNTYFIVYDTTADTFSFEKYSSDKYFDAPPSSSIGVENSTTIALSSGKATYYSSIRDNTYSGTATIVVDSFSKENNKLSNASITGKYEQVYGTIEDTFENEVYLTVY